MPKEQQVLASCDFLGMDDMSKTRTADSSSVETPHAEECQIVNEGDKAAYAPFLYLDHHLDEPATISVEDTTPFSTTGGVKMSFPAMLFHMLNILIYTNRNWRTSSRGNLTGAHS